MSNKIFTATEIKILSMNPYVKKVSSKGITYADEFKRIFISENEKGKFPREIFEAHGFDIQILGMKRVESSEKRWRAAYRKNGIVGLTDTRNSNSVRPSEKELSLEEKYKRLQAQNQLLKEENEEKIKNIILEAYQFKNRKKGARQIKMTLATHFGINYNLKRIRI